MKISKYFSSNSSVILLLFIIVVLLSVFYEIPTIEYASNCDGNINLLQIQNLRK